MKIRRLEVGQDGMADVRLMRDPIPRHMSIVDWGANNSPAVSWKAASSEVARLTLRTPPAGKIVDVKLASSTTLRDFIGETLDAWMAVQDSILASRITAAERGAQVRAITVQAGARIAAAIKILGAHAATIAAAHKAAGLKLPELPTASTLEGEIDRRRFRAAMEAASAYLMDGVLTIAKDLTDAQTATEAVLALFAKVADDFSGAAWSMPSGAVGVATKAAPEPKGPMRTKLVDASELIEELSEPQDYALSIALDDKKFIWTVKRQLPQMSYRYDVVDADTGEVIEEGTPHIGLAEWLGDGDVSVDLSKLKDESSKKTANVAQKADEWMRPGDPGYRSPSSGGTGMQPAWATSKIPVSPFRYVGQKIYDALKSMPPGTFSKVVYYSAATAYIGGAIAVHAYRVHKAAKAESMAKAKRIAAHAAAAPAHTAPAAAPAAKPKPKNPNFNPGYNFHRGKGSKKKSADGSEAEEYQIRITFEDGESAEFDTKGKSATTAFDTTNVVGTVVSGKEVVWASSPIPIPRAASSDLAVPREVQMLAACIAVAQDCDGFISFQEDSAMTLATLKALAEDNPLEFLGIFTAAVKAAREGGIEVSKKFMWGETGVDQYDPAQIMGVLTGFQNGDALLTAIAGAVAGVDITKASTTAITAAATMKSALLKMVAEDVKANPNGELSMAVKTALAPDIGEAVVATVKRVTDGGHDVTSTSLSFDPNEGENGFDLTPDLPGAANN